MEKKTPLYDEHVALKARIVDFAGYKMPISYTSIKEEHNAVRLKAGIFDVSHMGEIEIKGENALDFIQYLFTNDASQVQDGKAFYSLMCKDNGGIIDDVIIMKKSNDYFFVIVNASNIDKDFNWLINHSKGYKGIAIENLSSRLSMIAVQGPKAESIVRKALPFQDLPKHFRFTFERYEGLEIIISRTGYTGEDGFEIIMDNQLAVKIWRLILSEGKQNIMPCGLGARDTLRIEASYMLYGNDIDEKHTPIEAGLVWAVKEKNGIDYIGKETLLKQKDEGVGRKLIGFEVVSHGIPRHGDTIVSHNGSKIGVVTSATYGPYLKKTIGLGYVQAEYTNTGTSIGIQQRGKTIHCKIVPLPFYKRTNK